MRTVLYLLALQGAIGAFDTIYYHEYRAKLPALGFAGAPELRLHAYRDFLYAFLFLTLPFVEFRGMIVFIPIAVLCAEVSLTLRDFVVEDVVRARIGGVYPGERVTHAIMGILYGIMLAQLAPIIWEWSQLPSGIAIAAMYRGFLHGVLVLFGIGVLISGIRDLCASHEKAWAQWPWSTQQREPGKG
jgi:hypothetical protein